MWLLCMCYSEIKNLHQFQVFMSEIMKYNQNKNKGACFQSDKTVKIHWFYTKGWNSIETTVFLRACRSICVKQYFHWYGQLCSGMRSLGYCVLIIGRLYAYLVLSSVMPMHENAGWCKRHSWRESISLQRHVNECIYIWIRLKKNPEN